MSKRKFTFKVSLIGDMNVGKTCLALRLRDKRFYHNQPSTVGLNFVQYEQKIEDPTNTNQFIDNTYLVILHLWDTAGQERFRDTLATTYIRGSNAILLCCDLCNESSIEGLTNHWMKWLQKYVSNEICDDIKFYLIFTKSDKVSNLKQDEKEELLKKVNELVKSLKQKYLYLNQLKYYYTSSKTGDGVTKLFDDISKDLLIANKDKKTNQTEKETINLMQQNDFDVYEEKEGCC